MGLDQLDDEGKLGLFTTHNLELCLFCCRTCFRPGELFSTMPPEVEPSVGGSTDLLDHPLVPFAYLTREARAPCPGRRLPLR